MEEIDRLVWEKYPRTEKEKSGCSYEITRMDEIRKLYKQRLIDARAKISIHPEASKANEPV